MVVHIKKDNAIKILICNLFLVRDKDKNIPTGIEIIGVSIAIPGKPKYFLIFTINRLQEVKTLFVLFGNNFACHFEISSPKNVKTKTPRIPPPTVET